MNSNDLREKLIIPAVVGALYAALTMLLAPISYGNLQFRISEALCVLPVFFPYTSVGLFLGCALANMISAARSPRSARDFARRRAGARRGAPARCRPQRCAFWRA